MEFSAFTVMGKNFATGQMTYFNETIFIKNGNKICIQDSGSAYDAIVMPFDDLIKNPYVMNCYELSRVAIGKPNIDPDYYESDDDDYIPNPNNPIGYRYQYIDTLYIIEDVVTNTKEAKKGNTYQTISSDILENMIISTEDEIAVFYNRHNMETKHIEDYTALVNKFVLL
uniref:Uncharacterized protein n=1 Tax=viral metagenome TaxID=1070528 RepID=A0A6C0LIT7_9ZZZZ